MSAGKHTEGKWTVAESVHCTGFAALQVRTEDGTPIAEIWETLGAPQTARANAALTAAAPDLKDFAASWVRFVESTFAPINAKDGLRELDDDHELTITVEQFRQFYDVARAAIAKTDGNADA